MANKEIEERLKELSDRIILTNDRINELLERLQYIERKIRDE
tara:strand:- start:2508 stop:2633 length:126 start_codon:yes stop_codon:yes gene_type:complete